MNFRVWLKFRKGRQEKKKGWGIGLALVRAVSEAHGGSVAVDSSKERGTTFTIDIPVDSAIYQPKN